MLIGMVIPREKIEYGITLRGESNYGWELIEIKEDTGEVGIMIFAHKDLTLNFEIQNGNTLEVGLTDLWDYEYVGGNEETISGSKKMKKGEKTILLIDNTEATTVEIKIKLWQT